ncbi:EAL domain-containing protein [Thiocapsa sp.]|uniref:EAL domain-containing protein n=1 Tax=Thiocapsa sp. TaxID=2024551 RepID=UPI00359406E4
MAVKRAADAALDRRNRLLERHHCKPQVECVSTIGCQGTAEQLLVSADRALYAAKQAGRATWKLFETEMTEVVGRSQALAVGVFRAVAQQELDLDCQPIVDLRTLEVIAVEALVRWNHPERGRLSAQEFIHAVENGPAVLPLTRFVLH